MPGGLLPVKDAFFDFIYPEQRQFEKLTEFITKTMNKEFKLASDVYHDSLLELNDVAKLYQYIRKKL